MQLVVPMKLQTWKFICYNIQSDGLCLQLLIAGGGMYVEVFNRGVIPLAYSIQKKNKAGESNTYLDGIYLLFTYFTKPESLEFLEENLKADDNVIRSLSFKIRKRKYQFRLNLLSISERKNRKEKSFMYNVIAYALNLPLFPC